MKNGTLKRVLSLVMALAMLVTLLPTAAFAAGTTKTIYLKAGVWDQAGAWFDAWVWGSSQADAWYTFVDTDGDLVYEIEIPSDATHMKILRKDPASSTHDWNNIWNKSSDLTISGSYNCYNITGWSTGSWSNYDPSTAASVPYTVVGEAGLCGSAWDVAATANDMTKNAEGLYEKVFTDVAKGTYKFKVAANHAWDNSWGDASTTDGNAVVSVAEAGSTVTITFNTATRAITSAVTVPVTTYNVTFNGTNVTADGEAFVEEGNDYTATLTAAEGYTLPETVSVTVGGEAIDTFTFENGTLTIPADSITGDVVITAEAVKSTITVYFRNDWLWPEVYVHCWNDTDNNGWPGLKMTFVETQDDRDIYSAEIPLWAEKILFNGLENGSDTNRQETPHITEFADGDAFYIHWADDANQVSKFDYVPGTTTDPSESEDSEPSSSEEESSEPESSEPESSEPEAETVTYEATFHFADVLGWGGVNLYTWTDAGTHSGSWPGTNISKGEDGFYTMTVSYQGPAGEGLNFIFNNGAQTVDLLLPASAFVDNKAEKWVILTTADSEGKYYADILDSGDSIAVSPLVDGTSVTFQYKNDSAASVEVYGSWNEWASGTAMTKNANGIWTATLSDLEPNSYGYKFVVGEDWIADPMNPAGADGNSNFLILDPNAVDNNEVTINVYYDRADGIYETTVDGVAAVWNAYVWGDSFDGMRKDFEADANGNMVTTITVVGRDTQYVNLKTRLSTDKKDWVQEESQVSVSMTDIVSGTINVYVTSACSGGNKGTLTYTTVLGTDVVKDNKVTDLQLDYDAGTVSITTLQPLTDPDSELKLVKDGEEIDVTIAASGSTYTMTMPEGLVLDLVNLYQYEVTFDGYSYAIGIDTVYASDKFAEEYTYTTIDNTLGAAYTVASTTFNVWAPTAEAVSVKLYATGSDAEAGAADLGTYAMTRGDKGVWTVTIEGDLKNVYYTYAVTVDGETVEAVDPYARTTGVNGKRGMVVDLDSTDPEGWADDKNPNPVTSQTDAIIYELHVRDFSIDDSSGVSEANRGKYLAFTEEGTTTANGVTTGINYLDELGITHLHLLPVYDYGSVDETTCDTFNWGYDPQNYNTPEGSYSTNPYDGATRVNEFKQMVMSLHEHGISVVMDVVYNHVYDASKFCFNNIVPGYFSRVNSNTSGCGNDTASEREMVRKYIVESVLYWHQEYHIDGFRFDLVGLLDAQTINQIVTEVHKCCPDVIFYGEGWDMDGTNREPGTEMAKQGNAAKTPGFGYFSDSIRNLLAGNNGNSTGFVSGAGYCEGDVATNFMAKPWWTSNPQQVIQYASCHDNYTLIDKIVKSTGASGINANIKKMSNLAAAVYLTAQGVPFIHAGEEFFREKLEENGDRCENSYNASDFVNHIEWSNLDTADYAANVDYYQGLIEFRKAHPALRMDNAGDIKSGVTTNTASGNVVAMFIDGCYAEDTDDIFVIFNANNAAKSVSLPEGTWTINVKGNQAGTASLGTASGSVSVEAISAMVLTKADERQDENTGSDTAHDAPPAGYKTIYFTNNKGWSTVNAYAWNAAGSPVNGSWPGTEMTYLETNDYGEYIYYAIIPTSAANIIFNNGSEQTADLTCGVDGTGYYLVDNATGRWTAESYAYRDPVSSEELINLEGATMTLGNSLAMNFVIDTAELTGTDNYAVITKEYADGTEGKSVTINQADWKVYDGTMYYFTYSKVAAKEMTDKITVVVYNSAGEAVTNSWTDSVRDYCMRAIKAEEEGNKNQDKLTLYVDMLNYGAAAQNKFDYHSDDLATSQLTEAQKGYATGDVNAEDHRVTGAGYLGSTLTLGNEIELNFIFDRTTVTQDMYAIATYTNHYGKEKSVTIAGSAFGEYNKDNVKGWYIPVADMSVADGCQVNGESKFMVTCTVYNADGTVVTYARDSVASYVARANADTNNTNPLYTLILKFATSAYNYFH